MQPLKGFSIPITDFTVTPDICLRHVSPVKYMYMDDENVDKSVFIFPDFTVLLLSKFLELTTVDLPCPYLALYVLYSFSQSESENQPIFYQNP